MNDEIGRIAAAVASDVRQAVRRVGIRPQIRADAHVVMLVAARREVGLLRHGEWPGAQGCRGLAA